MKTIDIEVLINELKKTYINADEIVGVQKKYVIVRTLSAGIFAGYLENKNAKEVILRQVRRLWYWDGAASLSQLAMEGVSKPEKCKFPCEVNRILLTEAIEILDTTDRAQESIRLVPVWKE